MYIFDSRVVSSERGVFLLNPGLMYRSVNLENEARVYDSEYFEKEILPRGRKSGDENGSPAKTKAISGSETEATAVEDDSSTSKNTDESAEGDNAKVESTDEQLNEEEKSRVDNKSDDDGEQREIAEKFEKEKKDAHERGDASFASEIVTWDYFPDVPQSVKEPVLELDPSKCSDLELDNSPPKKRPPRMEHAMDMLAFCKLSKATSVGPAVPSSFNS